MSRWNASTAAWRRVLARFRPLRQSSTAPYQPTIAVGNQGARADTLDVLKGLEQIAPGTIHRIAEDSGFRAEFAAEVNRLFGPDGLHRAVNRSARQGYATHFRKPEDLNPHTP